MGKNPRKPTMETAAHAEKGSFEAGQYELEIINEQRKLRRVSTGFFATYNDVTVTILEAPWHVLPAIPHGIRGGYTVLKSGLSLGAFQKFLQEEAARDK